MAKIMNALAGAHDAAVQMIDTSIVRVHQASLAFGSNQARMHRLPSLIDGSSIAYPAPVEANVRA